jgi:hypothetical protein
MLIFNNNYFVLYVSQDFVWSTVGDFDGSVGFAMKNLFVEDLVTISSLGNVVEI